MRWSLDARSSTDWVGRLLRHCGRAPQNQTQNMCESGASSGCPVSAWIRAYSAGVVLIQMAPCVTPLKVVLDAG